MASIAEKIFGTHSERELKRIEPIVDRIEALDPKMQAMSDEVCDKIGVQSLTGEGVYVVLIINDKTQETDDAFMAHIFE